MFMEWSIQVFKDVSSSQPYLNTIPIKTPGGYFVDINRLILKFMWKDRRSRTANQPRRRAKLLPPYLKTHLTIVIIKTSVVLGKEQTQPSVEQKQSHANIVNGYLTKEQRQFNGEKIIFSINVLKQVTSTYRKKGLDIDLSAHKS